MNIKIKAFIENQTVNEQAFQDVELHLRHANTCSSSLGFELSRDSSSLGFDLVLNYHVMVHLLVLTRVRVNITLSVIFTMLV